MFMRARQSTPLFAILLTLCALAVAGCDRDTVVPAETWQPLTSQESDAALEALHGALVHWTWTSPPEADDGEHDERALGDAAHMAIAAGGPLALPTVEFIADVYETAGPRANTVILYDGLAQAVAPYDEARKREYLGEAIKEAQRALKTKAVWRVEPLPEGYIEDPQMDLDAQRHLLELSVPMWQAVLAADRRPGQAERTIRRLLKEGEADACCSDTPRPLSEWLLEDLAALDPALMVAAAPAVLDKEKLARFCYNMAYRRNIDYWRDQYTKFLIQYAARHGTLNADQARLLTRYNVQRAVNAAARIPRYEPKDDPKRAAALHVLVARTAETDLDGALRLAEAQDDRRTRLKTLSTVAWVWAQQRPQRIEEVVPKVEHEWRRRHFRRLAAKELASSQEPNTARVNDLANLEQVKRALEELPPEKQTALLLAEIDRASRHPQRTARRAFWRVADLLSHVKSPLIRQLYQDNVLKDPFGPTRQFMVLARADADFAVEEARSLPPKDQEDALLHCAIGIASEDWAQAESLVAGLSERSRREFFGHNWRLVFHPDRTEEVTGYNRMAIIEHAAATRYWLVGDPAAVEPILADLQDPRERDAVLGYLAERVAAKTDPPQGLRWLERIGTMYIRLHAATQFARAVRSGP